MLPATRNHHLIPDTPTPPTKQRSPCVPTYIQLWQYVFKYSYYENKELLAVLIYMRTYTLVSLDSTVPIN